MAGPTTVVSPIAADVTWLLENSPYLITTDVTIAKNVKLAVEAGVEVIVQKAEAEITLAEGAQIAFGGTKEMPIYMHAQSRSKTWWKGFYIIASGTPKIRAQYTTFENAQKLFNGVSYYLSLEDCVVRNCQRALNNEIEAGTFPVYVYFKRTIFERCQVAFYGRVHLNPCPDLTDEVNRYVVDCVFRENDWAIVCVASLTSGFQLYHCDFYRNRGALWMQALSIGSCTLASCWFGSDSGPLETVGNPSGTGDPLILSGAGTCVYIPWRTKGVYVPILDDAREYINRILKETTTSGEETSTSLLDDAMLQRILDRAEKDCDAIMSESRLEKRLLAFGTETDEKHDSTIFEGRLSTRYRPIVSIASLSVRSGAAAWTALTSGEDSGYYASDEDKRQGVVRLYGSTTYERDAYKLTYTHGYYDAPEDVRDVCLKLAAIEVLSVILKGGEEDSYGKRAEALLKQLDAAVERLRTNYFVSDVAVL